MIGYIGMILLLASYILLLTKYSKHFIHAGAVASFILTVHAAMIPDMPFFVVNGFITLILIIKIIKEERKK